MRHCNVCEKPFEVGPGVASTRGRLRMVCPRLPDFREAVLNAHGRRATELVNSAIKAGIDDAAFKPDQSAKDVLTDVLQLAAQEGLLEPFVAATVQAAEGGPDGAEAKALFDTTPCRLLRWAPPRTCASHLECDRSHEWELIAARGAAQQVLRPIFLRAPFDEALEKLHERIITLMPTRHQLLVAEVEWVPDTPPDEIFENLLKAISTATHLPKTSNDLLSRFASEQRVVVMHQVTLMDDTTETQTENVLAYHRMIKRELAQIDQRPDLLAPLLVHLVTWNRAEFEASARKFVTELEKVWMNGQKLKLRGPVEMIPTTVVEKFLEHLRREELWPEVKRRIHRWPLGIRRKPSRDVYNALAELLATAPREDGR